MIDTTIRSVIRLRIVPAGLNRAPCTTRVSAFEKAVRLFVEKPTDNVITLVLGTTFNSLG